jgi:hypothetical protein
MFAIVVVTPTPYTVVADAEGRFSISGVPSGSFTLTASAGAAEARQEVAVAGERTEVNIRIPESGR